MCSDSRRSLLHWTQRILEARGVRHSQRCNHLQFFEEWLHSRYDIFLAILSVRDSGLGITVNQAMIRTILRRSGVIGI